MIDIDYLKKTLSLGRLKNQDNPMWIEAFKQYNEGRRFPKSVQCTNCYRDVYLFHLEKQKVAT